MSHTHTIPTYPHFRLEELAEGVFAAYAIHPDGYAISNAGIIDLGDRTLVFDTFQTPRAAKHLRAAAEHLTGKPVQIVVNSHRHPDHTRGNQIFHDCTIIGTQLTRDQMLDREPKQLGFDAQAPQILEQIQAQLDSDPTNFGLTLAHANLSALIASLDTLAPVESRIPNLTFEDRLVIHGTSRTVEVLSYGGGHTDSDAFIWLPQDRIAFMGDLFYVECHAFFAHGHPDQWLTTMDRVTALDPAILVPGHGESTGTTAGFEPLRQYLIDTENLAREIIANGGTAQDAANAPIPEPYQSWMFPNIFATAMQYWYSRLAQPATA